MAASGASPEKWLGPPFYLVMPLCQYVGGILTGFLTRSIRSSLIAGVLWIVCSTRGVRLYERRSAAA